VKMYKNSHFLPYQFDEKKKKKKKKRKEGVGGGLAKLNYHLFKNLI
jgi:hypothetical protein